MIFYIAWCYVSHFWLADEPRRPQLCNVIITNLGLPTSKKSEPDCKWLVMKHDCPPTMLSTAF